MFRTSSLSFQGLAYVVFSFCVWGGLGGLWLLKDIPRFPNLHVLTSVVVILCGEWLSLFFLSVVKKDKTSGFLPLLIGMTGRTVIPFLTLFCLDFLLFQEKRALIVSMLFAYFITVPFHVILSLRLVNSRGEE